MIAQDYGEDLKEVIKASSFIVHEGTYIYASVQEVLHPEKHLCVIRDTNELTVVTLEENLPLIGKHIANKEKWKLVNVRCGKPFYCVGFIAAITNSLAAAGIDIVIASSFSNDLILVMENDLPGCIDILKEIGFKQKTL